MRRHWTGMAKLAVIKRHRARGALVGQRYTASRREKSHGVRAVPAVLLSERFPCSVNCRKQSPTKHLTREENSDADNHWSIR